MCIKRKIGAVWGVVGIVLLLILAITRLVPHAAESLHYGLSTLQIILAFAWCCFMVISEGYDGFQKRFAPRVVARAQYLYRSGTDIELLLAPLFCFGYFKSSLKRLVVSYIVTTLIVIAVAVVSHVPAPWRGIIDAGVVSGLVYGVLAIAVFGMKAIRHSTYIADPVIPGVSIVH